MNGMNVLRSSRSAAWTRRGLAALAACIIAAAMLPSRAHATETSTGLQIVYNHGALPQIPGWYKTYLIPNPYPLCIMGSASLNSDLLAGGGAYTFTACNQNPLAWLGIPAGNLQTSLILWVYDWNTVSWRVCYDGGVKASNSNVAGTTFHDDLRNVGCKGGYYMVSRGVWVWDGAAWQGGWLTTPGYVYSGW